jgi:hypothetical protein
MSAYHTVMSAATGIAPAAKTHTKQELTKLG